MPPTRRSLLASRSGFTLLEILTALVVLGVIVSLAAPSMQGVTSGTRVRGALDQFTADVALARMYAVRDGQRTVLTIRSGSEYVVVRDPEGAADTLKKVRLEQDFGGVRLEPSSGELQFDSRGLLLTGSLSTVAATHRSRSYSMTISSVGRTYREY